MAKKLQTYEEKRDFAKTAEPPPGTIGTTQPLLPGDQSQFFIQRHDASHLHYDFRLQIDGTLKSWAVPKGPSLDPAVKRLAMEVEDHPLAYGDFEGTIPKGEYGGGSVMLWDRGEFTLLGELDALEQLKKGDLKFHLDGQKVRGDFALVRTREVKGKQQWLLIKKKDGAGVAGWDIEAHATSAKTGREQAAIASGAQGSLNAMSPDHRPKGAVKKKIPGTISPMLATLANDLPQGNEWAYEIKWDGVRAICFLASDGLKIVSRNGLAYTKQFPELAGLANCFAAREVIADGEIVVHDDAGKPSFQALQPRLGLRWGRGKTPVSSHGNSAYLYLFDLIYCDGYDLRDVEFAARKAKLLEVFTPSANIRISQHFFASGAQLQDAARENGLEGIVAKRLDSPYSAGRNRAWLKVKFQSRQEFAICGWIAGKRKISSLVLGLRQGKSWLWTGNVGTGFSAATLLTLQEALEISEATESPFAGTGPEAARWVTPKLVAEVEFANWTSEGKLRAPVFLGLRVDKRPEDCKREEAVLIAKSPPNKSSPAKKTSKVSLTHLEKVYFPEDGITKGQLIDYYDSAADYLLPYLKNRPLSLRRYPDGIHGKTFFQKNLPATAPSWLETIEIYSEQSKRMVRYAMAPDRDSLLYLVNLGCIDHNPWMSRVKHLEEPDFLLIDLDPHECTFARIVEAAIYIKELMDALKLKVYVKTSGGHGIHIVAPLAPGQSYDEVRAFTESLARLTVRQRPDLFTVERSLKKRPNGRVYFDHVQIGKGKTIAAPYVVRPYVGAPVGTPLHWEEVQPTLKPKDFWMGNALERVKKVGDLFAPVLGKGQRLDKAATALSQIVARLKE